MSIKSTLRNSPITSGLYKALKSIRDEKVRKNQFKYHGCFIDRSKGNKYLCVVLAGYKEYLYSAVFSRLKKYATAELDICVVSSGKYSETLLKLCEENDWSYLSTKENNVSLVQNVAINLHPNAEYIFKLDEDVFIAEGFFDGMIQAYNHANESLYRPGVMAPLIPINGYGHVRVLEKLGLVEEYERRFGELKCAAGPDRPIEHSPDVARFMWGEGGFLPSIDEMNRRFSNDSLEERAVSIRFSIGAILFRRDLWESMGYFSVNRDSVSLGDDEVQLCTYCLIHSRPVMVSENVLVGHFSFGLQNKMMKAYYLEHESEFLI